MKKLCHSLTELQSSFRFLSGRIEKWPVLVSLVDGYNERSDKQNKLIHKNFSEADQFFNETPGYSKLRAKLDWGLPILARRENEPWWLDTQIRLEAFTYEVQIEFMRTMTVTSEMTTREMKEFIDTYTREWSQQGCRLTDPDSIDTDHFVELDQELRSRGVL